MDQELWGCCEGCYFSLWYHCTGRWTLKTLRSCRLYRDSLLLRPCGRTPSILLLYHPCTATHFLTSHIISPSLSSFSPFGSDSPSLSILYTVLLSITDTHTRMDTHTPGCNTVLMMGRVEGMTCASHHNSGNHLLYTSHTGWAHGLVFSIVFFPPVINCSWHSDTILGYEYMNV